MVKCKICNGNCDSGELTGSICPECLERQEQKRIRGNAAETLMRSPYYQMDIMEVLKGAGAD